MKLGKTIFSHLMEHLPQHKFSQCVERLRVTKKYNPLFVGISSFYELCTTYL